MIKKIYLLIVALFGFCLLHAQTPMIVTEARNFSSDNINTSYIDSEGNLWVGTDNGLNMYDGNRIVSIYSDPESKEGLVSDVILKLNEDNNKHLLIGTLHGMSIYDLRKEEIYPVKFSNNGRPRISGILVRRDGSILVSSSGSGALFSLTITEDGTAIAEQVDRTIINNAPYVTMLFEDSLSNLWIGTSENGLFKISQNGESTNYFYGDFSQGEAFTCMCEDNYGNLFLGGRQTGLYMLLNGNDYFERIDIGGGISTINDLKYHKGNVYVATNSGGILRYNTFLRSLEVGEENRSENYGMSSDISSITVDSEGKLYAVYNHDGIYCLQGGFQNFKYLTNNNRSRTVREWPVSAVCKDSKGVLYLGTDGDGLYYTSDMQGEDLHKVPGMDAKKSIIALYEDNSGRLWIGSQEGIHYLSEDRERLTEVRLKDLYGEIVTNAWCFEESHDGSMWIGTGGWGVFNYNVDTDTYIQLPRYRASSNANTRDMLYNDWINDLHVTENGKLYIATFAGLSCYDMVKQSFLTTFPDGSRLMGNVVINVIDSKDGFMWLSTDVGLSCLNLSDFSVKTYTTKDGLPGNNISSLIYDNRGTIWMSTKQGISSFNTENGKITNYLTPQGSRSNNYVAKSYFFSEDNQVMFGSQDGLTYFDIHNMENDRTTKDISHIKVYLNNKRACSDVIDGQLLKIKHKYQVFTIKMSTGNFFENKSAAFSYSLDDGPLVSLPIGDNSIIFNDLTSGRHKLSIKCLGNVQTYNDAELDLIVEPAWYLSHLAFLIYALSLISVVIFLILRQKNRFEEERLVQKQHFELEIKESRLKHFINIAHEIRMPMSLIISPLNKLMSTDGDDDRQYQYGLILNSAQRIMLLLNQLLDVSKLEKGQLRMKFTLTNVNTYLLSLVQVLNRNAKLKNIELNYEYAQENPEFWIDRVNFDKVILNLIDNAIKFTPQGGSVNVKARTIKDELSIIVSDNGVGLNTDKVDKIFDRFYQDNKEKKDGFGIGLNIVKSIVELHHGSVNAYNNESGGASFELKIPLGRKHLLDSELESCEVEQDFEETQRSLYGWISEPRTNKQKNESMKKPLVVLAEDSPEIREYLTTELSDLYRVKSFDNGKTACEAILKLMPDIVITDVIMPQMDGIALCESIKRNVNTNYIPVIMLTAKDNDSDRIIGMEAGADAYVTKPFNIVVLRKNIEQLMVSHNRLKNIYTGKQDAPVDEDAKEAKSPDDKFLERVNRVMNKNIGNTEFNVDMLSQEVGISRVHLYRKLKELTNQSPGDYIRNARLKTAAEMLSAKNHDVAFVSIMTGFTNPGSFSRAFKQLYGISPSEYHNLVKERD